MSPALVERSARSANDPVEVEVYDVIGQQKVRFSDVEPSTPVGDLIGPASSRLALPATVDFQMRDNSTSRLLHSEQSLGEVARQGKVDLTLQPDVRLG